MTEVEKKALALVNECAARLGITSLHEAYPHELANALCRAIEQHEAFRQEVSDAVEKLLSWPSIRSQGIIVENLACFIIPKPDPFRDAVVEGVESCRSGDKLHEAILAALAKRGLQVTEIER